MVTIMGRCRPSKPGCGSIRDAVVDLETNASQPLLLDPFLLEGGALLWQSFDDGDVEDGFAS
jgi:hypothetical protein